MKISTILAISAITLATFFIADNIYFLATQETTRQYSVQFRHAANYRGDHAAAPYYREISNPSLFTGKVKFRTGDVGEVLPHGGKGTCKVFFIGGSTTESHWMPEEERWPYLVGTSTSLAEKVRTYNFGVGGQNLHQNSIKYLALLRSLEPDIVVLNHQINDIGKHLNGGYYVLEGSDLYNSYSTETKGATPSSHLRETLFGLFPTLAGIWRNYRNESASARSIGAKSPMAGRRDLDLEPKEFLKRLRLLHQMTSEDGVQLVLIHQVNRSKTLLTDSKDRSPAKIHLEDQIQSKGISNEEYLAMIESYSMALKRFAKEADIPVIEADAAFESLKSDEYMYDSIHFTGLGSKEFAKIVSAGLEPWVQTRCK